LGVSEQRGEGRLQGLRGETELICYPAPGNETNAYSKTQSRLAKKITPQKKKPKGLKKKEKLYDHSKKTQILNL